MPAILAYLRCGHWQPSIAQVRSGHYLADASMGGCVGGKPTAAQHRLVGGHDLDRGRPLVGIHADHHSILR
jgi:hypothetical protein